MSGDVGRWRVWSDPRLLAWNIGQILLSPGLLTIKLFRYLRTHRPSEIDPARWNISPLTGDRFAPPASPHVVLVAASFGELLIAERLAEALRSARSELSITYAIRDPKTIAYMRRERPGTAIVPWPFDFLPPVGRWLNVVRPDLVVFTERFRFRNWCLGAARYGARVALVNGRCRPRLSPWYRWQKPVYRWQFGAFSALLMQRASDLEAVRPWANAGCDLRLAGDFKVEHRRPELTSQGALDLDRWLTPADSAIVAAGSVDEEAEARFLLEAFAATRRRCRCRLLIAPREIANAELIASIAERAGLTVSRRTKPIAGTDILLLDTIGELNLAYASCAAAYIGGFFRAGNGGHNIVEPLLWKVPVAFGTERGNFEEIQRLAEDCGAGTQVADSQALAAFFIRFVENEEERVAAGEAGFRMIERSGGALATTVDALLRLLPSV